MVPSRRGEVYLNELLAGDFTQISVASLGRNTWQLNIQNSRFVLNTDFLILIVVLLKTAEQKHVKSVRSSVVEEQILLISGHIHEIDVLFVDSV